MKLSSCLTLATGLLAFAAVPANAKIERSIEKIFTVQPGGAVRITTAGGNIKLEPSADGVVKVVAIEKFHVSTDAEADAILQKLTLVIEQNGNEVSASAKYEEGAMGFHFGYWPPVDVDFVVTVPASFRGHLNTSGGNITVGDLAGAIHAQTSGGNLELGKLGGNVDASTSGGNISLIEGDAAVELETSGGEIKVGRAVGAANLHTSGGDIEVKSAENRLHATTSGGSVRAGFAGAIKGDCVLETSGGDVRLAIDRTASFALDASTSGGEVKAHGLTIAIEKGGRGNTELAGDVNGGGPRIKLRSSGGDIVVETR